MVHDHPIMSDAIVVSFVFKLMVKEPQFVERNGDSLYRLRILGWRLVSFANFASPAGSAKEKVDVG